MKEEYFDIKMHDGEPATNFHLWEGEMGMVSGLANPRGIFIHAIHSKNGWCKKAIGKLVWRFKTRKITFTPLVNTNIAEHFRGKLKKLEAGHPENPYGEDMLYMECLWERR